MVLGKYRKWVLVVGVIEGVEIEVEKGTEEMVGKVVKKMVAVVNVRKDLLGKEREDVKVLFYSIISSLLSFHLFYHFIYSISGVISIALLCF